jgi:hypothetical protein
MELLDDVGQLEACFGPFADSVLEIWAKGTYIACISEYHQAIGPATIKGKACKG